MATETNLPADVTTEIERLRAEIPDTKRLYQEVCVLLFFRHGVTPTANKLYQLVHKGSMSAPTEALRAFWADLRDKSRVRIERADLPEEIRDAAGEMLAALWKRAQESADENLSVLRDKASSTALSAQKAQQAAESESARLNEDLGRSRRELIEAQQRILELERQLASERAGKESAVVEVEKAGARVASLDQALSDARRDFAAELEKQRQALERSEERVQGTEKRALLEIDRERMIASRAEKELEQLRQTQKEESERHNSAMLESQKRALELQQRLGQAEGLLQAQKESIGRAAEQLESTRSLLNNAEMRLAVQEREIELRETKIRELEAQVSKAPKLNPSSPRLRQRRNVVAQKKKDD
jgi:chromosome segregation ATPase